MGQGGTYSTLPSKANGSHLSVQTAGRAAGKGQDGNRERKGARKPRGRARERAPLFQQCGGVARTPASAAGRGLRQWGERRRWRRRQWQLCGRLRPRLLDGGVAEAPPQAAGTWREAEEYVREGSVDSPGGNRHACGQEAEAEQRREQQPGPLGRRECESSPEQSGWVSGVKVFKFFLNCRRGGGRLWGEGEVSPSTQENAGV